MYSGTGTGILNSYTVQVHCTGTLYRYTVQVHCTGTLYRYTVQVQFTGTLYRYTVKQNVMSKNVMPDCQKAVGKSWVTKKVHNIKMWSRS